MEQPLLAAARTANAASCISSGRRGQVEFQGPAHVRRHRRSPTRRRTDSRWQRQPLRKHHHRRHGRLRRILRAHTVKDCRQRRRERSAIAALFGSAKGEATHHCVRLSPTTIPNAEKNKRTGVVKRSPPVCPCLAATVENRRLHSNPLPQDCRSGGGTKPLVPARS
jgi:hypothetical protein